MCVCLPRRGTQESSKRQPRLETKNSVYPSRYRSTMCIANVVNHTSCGHTSKTPLYCPRRRGAAQWPCPDWDRREYFQAQNKDCHLCEIRLPQVPSVTASRSLEATEDTEEEPLRIRRGSLPDRYIPTPPPIPVSGYGVDEQRAGAADERPAVAESDVRISAWVDEVYRPRSPERLHANIRVEVYRPCGSDNDRSSLRNEQEQDYSIRRDQPSVTTSERDVARSSSQPIRSWTSGHALYTSARVEIVRRIRICGATEPEPASEQSGNLHVVGREVVSIRARPAPESADSRTRQLMVYSRTGSGTARWEQGRR